MCIRDRREISRIYRMESDPDCPYGTMDSEERLYFLDNTVDFEESSNVFKYAAITYNTVMVTAVSYTHLDVYKRQEFRQSRCPASPLRRKTYAIDEGREYAAAVNVMLAVEKLKDDKKDGFSPISAAGAAVLSRAGKRASERFPAAARAISTAMAEISEMERSDKPGDADRAADPFARMLAEIFRGIAYEPKEPLAVAGYNLGRWIYLIDAYDDAEKDAKSGNYNPYVVKYGKKAMERKADTVGKEAEFGLVASLEAASGAYGLLEIKKNKGITDNIMFGGLYKKTEYVLGKGK